MTNKDWPTLTLGEVITLQRGFDLATSLRNQEGTVPVVSSAGISGFHDIPKVQAPGVVTGRYGSIGGAVYLTEDFWPLNTTLYVADFKGNYPFFIYYLLQNLDFKKYSDKTGVPGVNRNDLHQIPVVLPPIYEQHKIAEILSAWDHAIDLTSQLIAAKQQRKRELIQQLLAGKRRFVEYEDEEWQSEIFEDIFDLQIGRTPARNNSDYWDTTKKSSNVWLSISDLKTKYVSQSAEHISDKAVQDTKIRTVPKGTVIMSFKLTIGRTAITAVPCYTNEAICAFYPKRPNKINAEYLYYALPYAVAGVETDEAIKGKTLNKEKISNLTVDLPSFEEQRRIAQVLQTCDREIELLQQKRDLLKQQKQGLMQQLLTGRVRVAVDPVEA